MIVCKSLFPLQKQKLSQIDQRSSVIDRRSVCKWQPNYREAELLKILVIKIIIGYIFKFDLNSNNILKIFKGKRSSNGKQRELLQVAII